jgi:hypothetical protein
MSFAHEGFSMFEIVGRFRQREEVIETVASLEIAVARVQAYKRQRLTAYLRPAIARAAEIRSSLAAFLVPAPPAGRN